MKSTHPIVTDLVRPITSIPDAGNDPVPGLLAAAGKNGPGGDWAWRSEAYAWFVVVVLTLSLVLSLIDRTILVLMIEPIKQDLGLSDTQIGLLHGLAFTILHILAGIPFGILADRRSRRGLAAFSVAVWSVMTALCGIATGFWQLFFARMGVGAGEAGVTPAAMSLVSDYFPKERRARPISTLAIGATTGHGLSLIIGGTLIGMLGSAGGMVAVPLLGDVRPWQAIFLILGASGVLFAAIFLAIAEPPRREVSADRLGNDGLGAALRFMRSHAKFFGHHFAGAAFTLMVMVAYHAWIPSFFIRVHGWTTSETGLYYGLCVVGAAFAGILTGGSIVERLQARGLPHANILVAGGAMFAATLPLAFATLVASPILSLACLFFALFGVTMCASLSPVATQLISPNEYRGKVMSIYLLVTVVIGYVLGPLAVALITDFVLGDERKIYISIAIIGAVASPIAGVLFMRAARHYPQ